MTATVARLVIRQGHEHDDTLALAGYDFGYQLTRPDADRTANVLAHNERQTFIANQEMDGHWTITAIYYS
jgi:hypothetical protein